MTWIEKHVHWESFMPVLISKRELRRLGRRSILFKTNKWNSTEWTKNPKCSHGIAKSKWGQLRNNQLVALRIKKHSSPEAELWLWLLFNSHRHVSSTLWKRQRGNDKDTAYHLSTLFLWVETSPWIWMQFSTRKDAFCTYLNATRGHWNMSVHRGLLFFFLSKSCILKVEAKVPETRRKSVFEWFFGMVGWSFEVYIYSEKPLWL